MENNELADKKSDKHDLKIAYFIKRKEKRFFVAREI